MPRIQIFKTGKHTSSNGVTQTYDNSFNEAVVNGYDSQVHISPVVAGHPKSDDPALAWVKSLHINGDVIEAEIDELNPEFEAAVKAGSYKKISASFFLPDSPSNPTPGKPYLRHIGILGAATPAVPGLRNLNFSASAEGVVEFDDGLLTNAGLFSSLRDWIISKFSLEDADQAIPASELGWLNKLNTMKQVDKAVENLTGDDKETVSTAPAFTVPEADARTAAVVADAQTPTTGNPEPVADFAEREAALAARQAELDAKEAALRDAECAQFCEGLVAQGKLPPASKVTAESLLSSLYKVGGTIDFSEQTIPHADAFKQFLSSLPKVVEFGELAPEDTAPVATTADFVAAPGYVVDDKQLREYSRLVAIAKQQGISLADAVAQQL